MNVFPIILIALIVGVIIAVLLVSRNIYRNKSLNKEVSVYKTENPAIQAAPAGVKLDLTSGLSKAHEELKERTQAAHSSSPA